MAAVDRRWVTTAFGFEGYKITAHLGVVRGITVRSRSIVGNVGAALQTLVGGNITIYTERSVNRMGASLRCGPHTI